MKKKLVKSLLVFILTGALLGCGGANKNAEEEDNAEKTEGTLYFKDINAQDYVTLGEYKGLEVAQTLAEVTEEDVENYISNALAADTFLEEITDRDVVETGDVANIDYEGKKDGVAFEGGTATGQDLTIGSGQFIPGFEDGLVGVKVGETVDLDLTFPEDYPQPDLAGAEVVFTVTVNKISQNVTPELTEEYVQGLGIENVKTVEEFRENIRQYLEAQAKNDYLYNVQMQLLSLVTENSQVKDAPKEIQQKYIDVTNQEMEYRAAYYGVDFDTFVQSFFNMDKESYEKEVEAGAMESAKQAMVCKRIAEVEGITVTDEDVNAAVEANYATWNYASVDDFKAKNDMEEYKDSLLIERVLDFLVENAKIVEAPTEAE